MSRLNRLIKYFSLPIILYLVFIFFRLKGYEPDMEVGLGDFITALNFLFGAGLSYFTFIFILHEEAPGQRGKAQWWWAMSILLSLLAFDELFMIHEYIGHRLMIKDTLVLLAYGIILGGLFLFNLASVFSKDTLVFLILFLLLGMMSQLSDYWLNEGIINLFGKDISYEQLSESLGALSLSCALATVAIRQISLSALHEKTITVDIVDRNTPSRDL